MLLLGIIIVTIVKLNILAKQQAVTKIILRALWKSACKIYFPGYHPFSVARINLADDPGNHKNENQIFCTFKFFKNEKEQMGE